MNKPLALTILLCLLLPCVVSAALVEYPQEYYTLGEKADAMAEYHTYDNWNQKEVVTYSPIASFFELRRHTILMERQNELIAEQNALLRNMTVRCPA